MTQLTFVGGTADWFSADSWAPTQIPVAGDVMVIGTGDATISATDIAANGGTLDDETVTLGSSIAAKPALFSAQDVVFGAGFTINATGSIDQSVLEFAGATVFDGTISTGGPGGTAALQINEFDGAQDIRFGGSILVQNGGSFVVSGGTFVDDGTIRIGNNGTGATMVFAPGTTLEGSGTILVNANSTLALDGAVMPGFTIDYNGTSGTTATIDIGDAAAFHGTVINLKKPDVLDLVGVLGRLPDYDAANGSLKILQGQTDTGIVANFTLFGNFDTSLSAAGLPQLFVGSDNAGGSRIAQIVDRTWNVASGDWYNSANWSSPAQFIDTYPSFGDAATIEVGTVSFSAADFASFGSLDDVSMDLGGTTDGGTVTIATTAAVFGADLEITTAGTAVTAVIAATGATSSSATISADGVQGALTIDVLGAGADFLNATGGQISVDSESGLVIAGGLLTNDGEIEDDQAVATLAQGATIDGTGVIQIQDGGTLVVAGTILSGQVALAGGSELLIAAGGSVAGTIDGFQQGDTIEISAILANYASFDTTDEVLTLRTGGSAGSVVASLQMGQEYGTAALTIANDGHGDTVISDTAPAPTYVQAILPVEIALAPAGTISLATILQDAFGTAAPPFASIQISSSSETDLYDSRFSYWDPNNPSVTGWTMNGTAVAPDVLTSVAGSVELVAGDDIKADATIQVPVAFDAGTPTEYVDYLIRLTDPTTIAATPANGDPTPQDIVATASLYAAAYSGVANTNDCYNIAGDVAGAAGAPIINNGSTIADRNASTGFWRQYYNGSYANAVGNWATLLQPGDIVRLEWSNGGQHSTTVLSTASLVGGVYDFQVFDNDANTGNYEQIGIHEASYEQQTNNQSISLFRLDPDEAWLVTGGTAADTLIQGSSFANLILPQGAGDIVHAGTADSTIADTSAILNGATIADFHAGDTIDFSDIDPVHAHVSYDAVSGVLTVSSDTGTTAEVTLAKNLTGGFSFGTDGGIFSGGPSDGGLAPPGVTLRALDGGNLGTLYTALGTLTGTDVVETAACYAAGTRITTADGEAAIECLAIGDRVLTASGAMRPIRWIGRRSYDGRFIAGNRAILPIVIQAGALADRVPRRDLLVSPQHAMLLDEVLIPADLLVNGKSIRRVDAVRDLTYLHVELDSHDVILAEGAPSESFVDCDSRMIFQNGAEYAQLYPEDERPGWAFCADRIIDGWRLENIRRRLAARAGLAADHVKDAEMAGTLIGFIDEADHQGLSGWAFDPSRPGTPVRLAITVDDVLVGVVIANVLRPDLAAAGKGDGRCGFIFHFPKPLVREGARVISVRRADDGAALDVPRVLAAEYGPLDGRIDRCSEGVIEGWVLDTIRPEVPVLIEVLADGEVVGRLVADRYRPDLAAAGKAGGRCSFMLLCPPLREGAQIEIRRAAA